MMATASPTDPLGFDMAILPIVGGGADMPATGASMSGVDMAIAEMYSRCACDTLPLTGAPGRVVQWGKRLSNLVGAAMTASDAAALGQEMAIVFARSVRLDPGSIVVTFAATLTGSLYAFTMTASARTTTNLPVRMVVGVSALSVDLLAQGAGSA